MDAYKDFAYVYDELMDDVPYEKWCERIVALIGKYGVSRPVRQRKDSSGSELEEISVEQGEEVSCGCVLEEVSVGQRENEDSSESGRRKFLVEEGREAISSGSELEELPESGELLESERNLVVDLGCGTGTLTQLLYDRGFDMIGVDASEEMLNVASQKKEASGAEILYLLQDMKELELYSTVGTVVSVCDSLNYMIEEEDLLTVFRQVENYLYPGGLFIFDFNTVYKYEKVIGDAVIAENREDCSFIWENYYYPEEELNEYDLTVFVQKEGDLFRRFTETHLQRGYTADKVKSLLEQAGLELIAAQDAETEGEVTESTQRVLMTARESRKRRL